MNLRASIAGAMAVIVAGVVVGVAIGGKTKTVTRTITVRTVSAKATATSSTTSPGSTTSSSTSTSGQTGQGGGATFPQYLSNVANPSNANFANVDQTSPVTVNGETFTNSVSLVDPQSSGCGLATISFPVPPGAKTLTGSYGWTANSSSQSSEQLLVYLNSSNSTPIWKRLFGSPGEPPFSKQLAVTGASEVIFQLADTNTCTSISGLSNTFFLGDARYTG